MSRPRRPTAFASAATAICVAIAGCSRPYEDAWSRSWPPRFPAGGTVTYRGEPVAGATVVFAIDRPDTRRSYNAFAVTDARGRFRLRTFRPQDGAVVGTHRVAIEKMLPERDPANPDESPRLSPLLPRRYGNPATSGLVAEVRERGPNQFVFALSDEP